MASPSVWDEDFNCYVHAASIADASGGVTVDSQARTALAAANAAIKLARITGRDAGSTAEPQSTAAVFDADRKSYVQAAAVADPSGGTTTDTQLRTATVQILNALRGARVIAHPSFGVAGPTVWDEDTNSFIWSAYTAPSGGATIDVEGRAQAEAIAVALRSAGLLTLD